MFYIQEPALHQY